MLMANVEHRQCLIDADDAPALDMFRQWPGDAPGAGRQVQHNFIAFDRQHLDQFVRQRGANAGHRRTPVELGGMRRIVKSCFVLAAVFVVMPIIVSVRVFMAVGMCVLVILGVRVVMAMLALFVIVSMLTFMSVIVLLLASMFVFTFVRHIRTFLTVA